MATNYSTLYLIANALAYGLIPIGLWWIIIHYRTLRIPLFGLFVHMAVVSVRAALLVHPVPIEINWDAIHLFTAALSAGCLIYGVVKMWRES